MCRCTRRWHTRFDSRLYRFRSNNEQFKEPDMSIAQLISPLQLAERQEQGGLVILDCRFALEDPEYGQRSYAEGHIAGACFADLERDLSGPVSKGKTGRHPLPNPQTLVQRLQVLGV